MNPDDASNNREPGQTVNTQRGAYTLEAWERVVDGAIEGPGYAVDLETDEILIFVSPSWMNANRRSNEKESS
jgi:hypothetical protein